MKTNAFIQWGGRAKMAVPVLLALFLAVGPAGSSFAQEYTVYADIRPCKCPNPLNLLAQGVVPVAISVTGDYDVLDIDRESVTLEGVLPILDPPLEPQFRYLTTPYSPDPGVCDDCTTASDEEVDLLLYYDADEVVKALPPGAVKGDCIFLEVTGQIDTSNGLEDFTAGDNVMIYSGKKQKP